MNRRELLQLSAASLMLAGVALPAAASGRTTVADHLALRLRQHGADVLFGVPATSCAAIFSAAMAASVPVVVTASDLEAAYAAHGFARFRPLAAVTVAYGVGTLGLLPVVAGAFAERCPIVVINGGPSAQDIDLQARFGALYSHSCGHPNADLAVYREVTAAAVRVERGADATAQIDAALRAALQQRRPVYIEVAKDAWYAPCEPPGAPLPQEPSPTGHEAAVAEQIRAALRGAQRPALLLGVELSGHGLPDHAAALVHALGVPWASTFLGKAVIDEGHEGFIGVYSGARSLPGVRQRIDDADVVVALGVVLGLQLRAFAQRSGLWRVEGGEARLPGAPPVPASLAGVVRLLAQGAAPPPPAEGPSFAVRRAAIANRAPTPASGTEDGLTYDQVLGAVSARLTPELLVVTDTSLSMYPASELAVRGPASFLCNGAWQAIGFSPPAAIGAALAQRRRPVVICGDGGFQMTAQALSTYARYKLSPVVLVLDNGLYGIEQFLLNPAWYNERTPTPPPEHLALHRWAYDDLARALGVEAAWRVSTPDALQQALEHALSSDRAALIHARIRPHDLPPDVRS